MNLSVLRLVCWLLVGTGFLLPATTALALDRTNEIFKIFQFPADKIPRIDGDTNDWNIVPESYVIGSDQRVDDNGKHKWSDASTPKIRFRAWLWTSASASTGR